MEMKKHLFGMSVTYAAATKYEEVVELPVDFTDEQIEAEFKEWVWNNLDAWREEV